MTVTSSSVVGCRVEPDSCWAPRHGTVREARIAGVISGSDRSVSGVGGTDWRLLGLATVMRASGADVSRSSAERAAGESVWVPGALPPTSATWIADDDTHVRVQLDVDGHELTLRHVLDGNGRLRSSSFDRWGDPDETGRRRSLPFGVEVTAERRFADVTVPSQGRASWHVGTDRRPEGECFRCTITDDDASPERHPPHEPGALPVPEGSPATAVGLDAESGSQEPAAGSGRWRLSTSFLAHGPATLDQRDPQWRRGVWRCSGGSSLLATAFVWHSAVRSLCCSLRRGGRCADGHGSRCRTSCRTARASSGGGRASPSRT